jgi:hypothetical protein
MNMTRSTILVLLLAATACGTPPAPTSPAPTSQTPTTVSCQPALTLDKTRFIADGDNATAQVTTSVDRCAWAVSAPNWITVTPSSGIGGQLVTVKAAATTGDKRSGEIAVGAARVPVTQDAWSPMFQWARCRIARAGRNIGICTAAIRLGAASRERGGVTADLRPLNGPASWDFVYITGGEWDLDLGVPDGVPPGVVPLTFSARDHSGRVHTITAELEVR